MNTTRAESSPPVSTGTTPDERGLRTNTTEQPTTATAVRVTVTDTTTRMDDATTRVDDIMTNTGDVVMNTGGITTDTGNITARMTARLTIRGHGLSVTAERRDKETTLR